MKFLLHDRPLLIGTLGAAGTVILENIHLTVGIAVGLTTLLYLIIRIKKELKE